jgi:hypothetical protein
MNDVRGVFPYGVWDAYLDETRTASPCFIHNRSLYLISFRL